MTWTRPLQPPGSKHPPHDVLRPGENYLQQARESHKIEKFNLKYDLNFHFLLVKPDIRSEHLLAKERTIDILGVYPLQQPPSIPPFFQTIYIDVVTILISTN